MSLYMESTRIEADKTIGEIQSLLGSTGSVRAIQTEYDAKGRVSAVSFAVEIRGQRVPFRLPARVEPVFRVLQKKRRPRTRTKLEAQDREQAVRVAWRQVLRWIQAQLALIETGMAELAEVFMPYVQVGIDETLYQRFLGQVETGRFLPEPRP